MSPTIRLEVRSKGPKGFFRAGRQFGPEPVEIDVDAVDASAIINEAQLYVRPLDGATTREELQAFFGHPDVADRVKRQALARQEAKRPEKQAVPQPPAAFAHLAEGLQIAKPEPKAKADEPEAKAPAGEPEAKAASISTDPAPTGEPAKPGKRER